MITAIFENNQLVSYSLKTWQYDYGQTLRIEGLNLPTAVEIHFSLTEKGGEAVTRVGMTKDGVTDVVIPDSFLENNDIAQDYQIYAFIYLRDDTSGQTEYKIPISVTSRPKPEAFNRPEDGEIFKEAIQAVRESADQAAESARQAELIKDSVQDMVDTIGSIDEQVQAVKGYAQKAETASSNAELSESRAKESETAAETAKTAAVQSAESAKQSEAAVETARQEVAENKTAVEQAVSGFDEKVAQSSTAIESAKTEAVKAVEDKGDEVLQSIPPDFETQMANKVDKQQGIENKGKALVVGEDGNVTVGEVTGGDGIPIINTMSGESPLVVPDSAERVNKGFSLIGKSEQVTTTGTQLFDISKISAVNVAVDKDMIIVKVYSSNTGITADQFMEMTGLKPGDKFSISYTFEGAITDSTGGAIFLGASKNLNVMNGGQTGSLKNTVILPSDFGSEYGSLYFYGNKSGANCYIKNFMINKGESVKPYEPYTGGKPSPSPEYPQEIKSVGKWNEGTQKYEIDVILSAKNLFNPNRLKKGFVTTTGNGFKIDENSSYVSSIYLDMIIPLKHGQSLSISGILQDKSRIRVKHDTGNYYNKYTANKDTEIMVCFCSGLTEEEKGKCMIEIGGTPTEYEPYKEQTLTLTSDRPITKWDKLLEQDGQIGWLYGAKIVEFTGNEKWTAYKDFDSFYATVDNVTRGNSKPLCNKYVNTNITNKEPDKIFSVGDGSENQIWIRDIRFNLSLQDFKLYLQEEYSNGTPIKVLVKAKLEEFIPLPQSEQDAIRTLTTYYPTTVITVDGGEVDPNIEVTYTADTKNYIDQKTEAINKAIVTTQKALLQEG